jgi:hypothetical protein
MILREKERRRDMTGESGRSHAVGAKTATLKGCHNSDDQTGIPGLPCIDRWFAPSAVE